MEMFNDFELSTFVKTIIKVTLCVIVIYVIRYKVRNRRRDMLAAQIPGPPALPIIGNTLEILGSTTDILNAVDRLTKTYRSPLKFWLGPLLYFAITDPEDLEVVLNSKVALEKDERTYRFGDAVFGKGLATAPVSIWRHHRRIIAPMFNSQVLLTYIQIFNKQAKLLVEKLEPQCAEGRQFDMFNFVTSCILNTVFETMLGFNLETQGTENKDFIKAFSEFGSTTTIRAFTFWQHPDWLFNLTKAGKIQADALLILNGLVAKVIKVQRDKYRLRKLGELEDKEEKDGVGLHRNKVFLDHLLNLNEIENKLTFKELTDEISTFIAAGYDTSSIHNSTVLLLLAIHQDEQARVYDELRNIFGDSDRDVTMEDTKLMTRLDMVMMEAMRLFTILPLTTRRLTEDLQVRNYTLPKGSSLIIWTQTMHRNSKIYPEPEKFDPERFSPENVMKRHRYSFLPFSEGPRNCIGLHYENVMTKVVLATVIRKYHLHSDTKMEDIQMKWEIVQKMSTGYPIRLEQRKI